MLKIKQLFVYGSLRPDFKSKYCKEFLNEFKPIYTKAYVTHCKLAYNKIIDSVLIIIDKEKYTKEDIVEGYLIQPNDLEGLVKVLVGKKSEGSLEIRSHDFVKESGELEKAIYLYNTEGEYKILDTNSFLEFESNRNKYI